MEFMAVILLFVLAALPLLGLQPDSRNVPFRLYIDFQQEPSRLIKASLQDEVDAIMNPLDWTFQWSSLGKDTNLVSTRLAIVHFIGVCGVENPTKFRPYPFVLGTTEMSGQRILPFANIFCDAIHAHLAADLQARKPADRGAIFGRALGRVLAHELYHIFGNTPLHAYKGLGKATYTPQELLADGFGFGKKEVARLRAQAARALWEWKNDGFEGAKAELQSSSSGLEVGVADSNAQRQTRSINA